jgi:hypothetical protein
MALGCGLTSVRGNRGENYENEPLVRQKNIKEKNTKEKKERKKIIHQYIQNVFQVDLFFSRDLDSRISGREVSAVHQFLQSNMSVSPSWILSHLRSCWLKKTSTFIQDSSMGSNAVQSTYKGRREILFPLHQSRVLLTFGLLRNDVTGARRGV